jgi:hypothetical protein
MDGQRPSLTFISVLIAAEQHRYTDSTDFADSTGYTCTLEQAFMTACMIASMMDAKSK